MAFLENLNGFYGTGERDQAGRSLEEFLASYDPKQYDCPSNTADIIVVRCGEKLERWGQPLQVLLVKRSNHPSVGFWATPGGFVELREDLYQGAARELEEETGVKGLPLQQLFTWGAYDRDPRWRVITTSFLALVEGDIPVKAGDDAADALWMDVDLQRVDGEKASGEQESQRPDKEEASGKEESAEQEIWQLTLTNRENAVELSAQVKITRSGHHLLSQESYQLLENKGLAVDHGCLITQALLYLKKRL